MSNFAEKYYTQCLRVRYREMILEDIIHNTSHPKGKASTAKQTCLGSLLGLELNLYCVLISSLWRHLCQLDISQRYRANRPQSSSNELMKSRSQTAMRLAHAELALYLGCGCPLDIPYSRKFSRIVGLGYFAENIFAV